MPQIRNVGTLGGNLCQRPRCWYFRGKLFDDCIRKGGGTCYAHSPKAENQYHAIMGGDICSMVYPSDMAPALIALDAKVEIAGPKGRRVIPLEKFLRDAGEEPAAGDGAGAARDAGRGGDSGGLGGEEGSVPQAARAAGVRLRGA